MTIDTGRGDDPGSTTNGNPASTPRSIDGGIPPSDTPTGIEQAPNGSTVGSRALRSPTPPSRYGTPSGHAGPGYAVVGTSAESVVLPEIVQRASAPGALDSRAWWSMTTIRAPELPTPLPWPPRRATSW